MRRAPPSARSTQVRAVPSTARSTGRPWRPMQAAAAARRTRTRTSERTGTRCTRRAVSVAGAPSLPPPPARGLTLPRWQKAARARGPGMYLPFPSWLLCVPPCRTASTRCSRAGPVRTTSLRLCLPRPLASPPPSPAAGILASFILSIAWIGLLSHYAVLCAERVGCILGIPSPVMGLTVIAAGTSVPDALSSVIGALAAPPPHTRTIRPRSLSRLPSQLLERDRATWRLATPSAATCSTSSSASGCPSSSRPHWCTKTSRTTTACRQCQSPLGYAARAALPPLPSQRAYIRPSHGAS